MLDKIHHIGIVVSDLEAARNTFERLLGVPGSPTKSSHEAGIATINFDLGETGVELLGSLRDDTSYAKFLRDRGEGLHHMAYAVKDIDKAAGELRAAGFQQRDEKPRIGMHGVRILFFEPSSMHGVLTELVEEP
jgi:methylmalonyl-CoA/ethylmalonyl-CoA epimerase